MLPSTSCIEITEVLSARGLIHVPKNLSENLTILDLSNNKITAINIDDFRKLEHVKTIDLSYNQIRTLHERSFEHVYCLEELDLSYNDIVHLPHSIFSSNQNLTKLYLKKNRLQLYGDLSKAEHILDSQSLIYLDVSFCNITYISCEGLPNLKTLITDGNRLTQQDVEIINPPENLRTTKPEFCNSSTFQKFSYILQEQGVEITPTTLSPQTKANGENGVDPEQGVETTSRTLSTQSKANGENGVDPVVLNVGIIMSVSVFLVVVTGYFLIIIRMKKCKSGNAIQKRPLPPLPFQDGGYEVPIAPSNECISSVTSSNTHLNRNCGYIPVPSVENDNVIKTYTTTCHVLVETHHGSAHSLTGSSEYHDNLPHPSSIHIYSHSDVTEEEEEDNLPLMPMDVNFSISTSPQFSGANQPSTPGIPPRPCQRLRYPQDGGYNEKMEAPTGPPPTSPASPTRNVTTFSVKKINSENVFISSTSIALGQGS